MEDPSEWLCSVGFLALSMSPVGQVETFPALSRMSALGSEEAIADGRPEVRGKSLQ
jgi:hypothetical protein